VAVAQVAADGAALEAIATGALALVALEAGRRLGEARFERRARLSGDPGRIALIGSRGASTSRRARRARRSSRRRANRGWRAGAPRRSTSARASRARSTTCSRTRSAA
jgi:hypothetical protein